MDGYKLYHMDDSGRKVDLSDKQKELADQAKDRSAEKIAKAREDDPGMTDDEYMLEEYADDHDEYLVDGARLKCSHAIREIKVIQGKIYRSVAPDTTTVLKVTENPKAKCCGYLYHATVKDRKVKDNIPPFRCNCDREPHNEKEWAKLEADETCLYEGTCKALIDLEDEWDNLPTMTPYLSFGNDGDEELISGITMSSVLFCRHGGFITPLTSGQVPWVVGVFALDCATSGGPKGALTDEQKEANARYIYNFFKKQGWTTEAICGMLGNIQKECGMNPGAWQKLYSRSLGYGLVQWSPSEDYMKFAGMEPADLHEMAKNDPQGLMDKQLEYLVESFGSQDPSIIRRWYETSEDRYYKISPSENVPRKMSIETFSQSTYDSKDLALVFHASYERSGDNKEQLQERMDAADAWYQYFTE